MKRTYLKPVIKVESMRLETSILIGSKDNWADGKQGFFDDEIDSEEDSFGDEGSFTTESFYQRPKSVWDE